MGIDRNDKYERRVRADALIDEALAIRHRGERAISRARELVQETRDLFRREERRRHRETLLQRTREALHMAKADTPVLQRLRDWSQKTGT